MNSEAIIRAIGFLSENAKAEHIISGPNGRILIFADYIQPSESFKCVYIFDSDGNYKYSPELSMFQQKRDFFLGFTDKWD